jgi:hypothetical protein
MKLCTYVEHLNMLVAKKIRIFEVVLLFLSNFTLKQEHVSTGVKTALPKYSVK